MSVLRAYTTVAPGNPGEALFEDKKSQFFGFAVHAESADEAVEFRHRIMERIPDARHYVSAWVLANGAEFYSDAKEPHGTAGLPVLNAIKGRGLEDVACVVARVFGGTLLGKGGLMRAYTKAASDALGASEIIQRVPCRLLDVTLPYQLYDPLLNRLPGWEAQVDATDFTEYVTLHLSTRAESAQTLADSIRDFTNAQATCAFGSEELRYVQQGGQKPTPAETRNPSFSTSMRIARCRRFSGTMQ